MYTRLRKYSVIYRFVCEMMGSNIYLLLFNISVRIYTNFSLRDNTFTDEEVCLVISNNHHLLLVRVD